MITQTAPIIITSNFIMLLEVLSDILMLTHGRTKSSNNVAPRELRVLDIVLKIIKTCLIEISGFTAAKMPIVIPEVEGQTFL